MKFSQALTEGMQAHLTSSEPMLHPAMCTYLEKAGVPFGVREKVSNYMRKFRQDDEGYNYVWAYNYIRNNIEYHPTVDQWHDWYSGMEGLWRQYYFFMIFDLARKGE